MLQFGKIELCQFELNMLPDVNNVCKVEMNSCKIEKKFEKKEVRYDIAALNQVGEKCVAKMRLSCC